MYIVWALAYHSFDRDGKHDDVYFYGWISFWVFYTVAMQSYAKNSLAGLTNYMNVKIVEDLQPEEPDVSEQAEESEHDEPEKSSWRTRHRDARKRNHDKKKKQSVEDEAEKK